MAAGGRILAPPAAEGVPSNMSVVEDIEMSNPRFPMTFALLVGLVATAPNSVAAQDTAGAAIPSCTADWACGSFRPPLGFFVDTVEGGGRYVTLEDGTIWEVQLDHRATVDGWEPGTFVRVHHIAAPTRDYEWLFTKADRPGRAAARLVGRVRR